jgi:hypothetical protein
MSTIRTTRRLLNAYADEGESWKGEHDQAQSCLEVQEKLAWGVHLFRGLMAVEARAQAYALRESTTEVVQLLEIMPVFYQLWIAVSERYLRTAQELIQTGFAVEGLDELREALEEARCMLGNLELEEEIPSIEELLGRARPDCPRPGRYAG